MSSRAFVAATVLLAVLIAGVLSGFASTHPDGLESVAAASGFASTSSDSVASASPLADYEVSWWGDSRVSAGVAGVLGCVLASLLVTGVTRRKGSET